MCKKLIAFLLLFIFLCGSCFASGFNEDLFIRATAAITCMSSGDYQKALDALALSDSSIKASDLRLFAQTSFTSLNRGVQNTLAVACYTDEYDWIVAVPLSMPDDMDVEALILRSTDGQTFDCYLSGQWSVIERLFQMSDNIIWYTANPSGGKVVVAN